MNKLVENEFIFSDASISVVLHMSIRRIFMSNHNIHKSLYGLCFWASDPLIERS